MKIDRVTAHPINDTRGRPTIETTLHSGEISATASVPSGKSTGEHEACELRDADGNVTRAITNVSGEIAKAITGRDFSSLDELDTFLINLDGTPNKSRLGANAILSVSIAAQRLSALQENIPLWQAIAGRAREEGSPRVGQVQRHPATPLGVAGLSETLSENFIPSEHTPPRLFVNVMNGGVHAHTPTLTSREARPEGTMPNLVSGHANFRLPFQEYMLVVEGKTSIALPIAQKAFNKLGKMLGENTPMGDEGGYAPIFNTIERPFEILAELVNEFPETSIAVDVAASQLFHGDVYNILGESYSAGELERVYEDLVTRFPLSSIEDPFDENASVDFIRFTKEANNRILVIGDDLTCTNPERILKAIELKEINAVLIKPNQIGTVLEAIRAVQETQAAGFKVIASHRSGETSDTFIADFAYGVGAYGIKAGGLGQPERLEKYDRLLAIEHEAKK